ARRRDRRSPLNRPDRGRNAPRMPPSPHHTAPNRPRPFMNTSAHRFSRRTFLRGVGVSMGLPWLESLNVWGNEAEGKARKAPRRVAVLFSGNGFHSREWWARGRGSSMELGKVLAPLQPHREKMLFIQGLFNAEALKGNIHSSQTGNLLSGAPLASGGEI